MRRRYRRKQRKIIIVSFISLLLVMSVGYAAFNTNLNISAKGNIKPIPAAQYLKTKVVDSKDGLYLDTYDDERYFYKGNNPDNYIKFNDELWRIISVEPDETLKIIKNESIGVFLWNSTASNVWSNASLNIYLNNDYYESFSEEAKGQVVAGLFNAGAVTPRVSLQNQISEEKRVKVSSNVGMISISEVIRLNSNTIQCGSHDLHQENYNICLKTNWMVSIASTAGNVENTGYSYMWLISSSSSNSNQAWMTTNLGQNGPSGQGMYVHTSKLAVAPVIYLKADISLLGAGTKEDPYLIKKSIRNYTFFILCLI